ncbi:glycoside hydrolase family 32 protein [Microbacterium sp. M3]|uniref:Glycoside hydrolase family 32 protein n=1 Tax=Microbacterium arthrosphaerae TaxID=792652 RepID=A0ABU4H3M8_9MICO|nr:MULTISPECIES: glycoside hydrolase family 32 protein [Microbacterium]MDW4573928.1 glycoside hydrolase family 32 protein [Microbacterium arthrosphaerae]MDW7607783.1 glycoside hydrolase family 32 protein [Microbacterium sp. M3]
MHAHDAPTTFPWRRSLLWAAAAIAVVALGLGTAIAVLRPWDGSPDVRPTPTATSPDTSARPADWSVHRPGIHLTPGENWMNDPQKPFLLDGVWHYYYLYNADYPDGNGTAWYHATSTDLVHWTDEGVAIDKYANGLGDIWTGTAVVDEKNTAGFGEGAVIALVTQQVDGVQRQSLFVSRDGGYRFESFEGNPVMDNPGVADWRDPRVFWDDAAGRWAMALAEHDRIGFYTSPNLRDWTYASDFVTTELGVLECPDLFPMAVDGDPDDVRWVLVAGANGAAEGKTTGTAYWVGEWDGERFTADGTGHQWMDHGPDFYAAVTWDDPRLDERDRLASRYSIGWMNNWAYADRFPTEDWYGGSDSLVRSITLDAAGGRATLRSTPAPGLDSVSGVPQDLEDAQLPDGGTVDVTVPASGAYRLRLDAASPAGELRVKVLTGDGSFATVGYDFESRSVFVTRDSDAVAGAMPETYREVRTAAVEPADGRMQLDIVVDAASIEVFAGGGRAALTMATFGTTGERGLELEAVREEVSISAASLTPLRVAPVERE